MPLTFESKVVDDVAVIRCKGRITFGPETYALEAEIDRHTKVAGTKIYFVTRVALNLAEAEFIDSGGLGTLVRLMVSLRAAGGGLKLCQPSPKVLRVVQTMNLGSLFPEYASEREAVEAFEIAEDRADERSKSSKIRIVCVDPSNDLLAGLYALLSPTGHEVFTTRFVGEATALAKASRPAILVCGPGMITVPTASAAIDKLRQNGEGIEVLQLPSDFYTADAGQAGQELLSRVQAAISARGPR